MLADDFDRIAPVNLLLALVRERVRKIREIRRELAATAEAARIRLAPKTL